MKKQQTESVTKPKRMIKLGIDAHARSYRVARQIDGATPQPAQKFTREGLLHWAAKQLQTGAKVYSCYESGPLGYRLHRELIRLGVENIVVQPQKLDERGKGIKNDKFDAHMLVQRLDRFVNGNTNAFAIVRVPSEEEEQQRSRARQCEQLKRHRKRAMLQGNSLLLYYGYIDTTRWWGKRKWIGICEQIPDYLRELLEPLRELILKTSEQEEALKSSIEAEAPRSLPLGLGCFTFEQLRREVGDWHRFKNRRQVASYTGLCPREHSSGGSRRMGSINKHGNPRVRASLIELSWRLLRWQPSYHGSQRWLERCQDPKTTAGIKKKAVVAMARQLAIDLWRLFTGQTTPENLGLIMKEHVAAATE